jgi:enoyl-CoA hydratase/carnithine racemase
VKLTYPAPGVALLTLNRPSSLNALNDPLAEAIMQALTQCDGNASVGAMVITGEGKAFVAGADIKMMQPLDFSKVYKNDLFSALGRMPSIRKPIIAAVNGFALGGGCELAMMCDIIIASEKAVFGQPEIKLGTIPGLGGTQRLTGLIGKSKAMEWVLTGDQYSAEEAERAGLVARVVKPDQLIPKSVEIAAKIASYSQVTAMIAKEAVNASLETTLEQGLGYEKRCFQSTFGTADRKEGMTAFVEKRKPAFKNE